MTTTVRVLIEGNKNCMAEKWSNPADGANVLVDQKIIEPNKFVTLTISGTERLIVEETGDFLT
jgi:hypothetical protein